MLFKFSSVLNAQAVSCLKCEDAAGLRPMVTLNGEEPKTIILTDAGTITR